MDTPDPLPTHAGQEHLWQAGTDHAGIAAQMVVERKIAAEEGKPATTTAGKPSSTRSGGGRKSPAAPSPVRCAVWQLRGLGSASASPWTRGLPPPSRSLCSPVQRRPDLPRQTPGELGSRSCNTAISDLEVENREIERFHVAPPTRWPTARKPPKAKDYLVVATTRPETMLGDTARAVKPGRSALQRSDWQIPAAAGEPSDPDRGPTNTPTWEKGTGCMKITPATTLTTTKWVVVTTCR